MFTLGCNYGNTMNVERTSKEMNIDSKTSPQSNKQIVISVCKIVINTIKPILFGILFSVPIHVHVVIATICIDNKLLADNFSFCKRRISY